MIQSAIQLTGVTKGSFCDFFAGSGVVSRLAKSMGFRTIANDWEPYAETINLAYIQTNHPPRFAKLGGMKSAIETLNSLTSVRGYIASHYCPADDENPDFESERMFYTQENGQRIDAIREQIEVWQHDGLINEQERAVLLAPLIYQASYCSNTSGVFKGFHRGWGGRTSTALYRIRSKLTLSPPLFCDNGQDNLAVKEDATLLADRIKCDIAYIDPPYNQHQYGANYHLLNTIALWDKPQVTRYIRTGVGQKGKSAIRLDWRTARRSPYCYASTALPAFSNLLARIHARYVLISYSTDGIIPIDNLLGVLAQKGHLSVITRHYKRYRVSSQRPSHRSHTVEFIAIVDTSAQSEPHNIEKTIEQIRNAELSQQSY
jgi:adenine-specific DNA-methyltransferase